MKRLKKKKKGRKLNKSFSRDKNTSSKGIVAGGRMQKESED